MEKATNTILVLILVVMVAGFWGVFPALKGQPLGSVDYNDLGYSGITNSSVAISATTTTGATNELVSAKSGRLWARFENVGPNDVWCHLDSATTTLAKEKGIELNVGDVFEIGPENLYKGAIMCMATSSTSTIEYSEK